MVGDGFPRGEAFDGEVDFAMDLTSASDEGLRRELARLAGEERELAGRLELVRGRILLARSELAGRGLATVPAEELARVLLGEEPGRASWGRGDA